MGFISMRSRGDYSKADKYFELLKAKVTQTSFLNRYGEIGVAALMANTPQDTGKTADSWRYEIHYEGGDVVIAWCNDNVNDDVNIAVILQYGHGTGTGGYVEGRDYINPAMLPTFDWIAEEAWKEVTSL